ncbi:MAG: GHKL domain-containing protein, partial [Chitinophagaceae bacterium]
SLYDLMVNADDKKIIEKELQANGAVTDKEIVLNSKNKERIDCILTVSREKNGEGEFYIQGILHNITLLKKSEKAFLQTEKLNAVQRLLLTLAHEVRNPLTNIYLSLDQLRPNVTAEGPQNLVEIISRNSKRISSLITQLLDTSKPVEIDLQKLSLNKVVEESVATALDRVMLKNIELQVNYNETDVLVMADLAQLKIAFLNIIINAIEAMEENEGKLLIEVKSQGPKYIVTITDNGYGISEEDITKLFEPYFTSKPKGMGLGLASTLNILQSHKAVVEVTSEIGVGTTFTIAFDPA